MGDVRCVQCGEPWDFYGVLHGDMTREEAKLFLEGKGCPSCMSGKRIRKGGFKDTYAQVFLEGLIENLE